MEADHKALVLQHGPIGLWRTSSGSADVLGADDVRFDPDGTGTVTTRSMMRGMEVIPFCWMMSEPGRLRLRYPPDEQDDEPDYWNEIRLEFRRQTNDLGELDVLAEVGQEGFWWLVRPLRWIGPREP